MSTNSFPALRVPIIDLKTGMMDWTWIQWFVDAQNRLQNGLNQLGQLKGNIAASTQIIGRSEGIGTTVQHLSDTGVIDSSGMTSATPTAQGAVILPEGASGNTLGSAAMQDRNAFDAVGAAATAQANAEGYTDTSSAATLTSAENFAKNASNITEGNLPIAQLPAAGITVTITTAKLTTLGANGSMTFQNGLLVAQVAAT
jgi:hypothetical protein